MKIKLINKDGKGMSATVSMPDSYIQIDFTKLLNVSGFKTLDHPNVSFKVDQPFTMTASINTEILGKSLNIIGHEIKQESTAAEKFTHALYIMQEKEYIRSFGRLPCSKRTKRLRKKCLKTVTSWYEATKFN